jgi:peptide chain release factor subunit 1
MVTKTDLASLHEFEFSPGRVLSVYLDVDQSKAANLNRGFEAALERELQAISRTFDDESALRDFESCADRAREFVAKYVPGGRGLVVYAKSNRSMWARELTVPTETCVRWGEAAYLHPLVEALDEYERYGLVLVDRLHAYIYTVFLGQIEKRAEIHGLGRVRHVKSAGRDHLYSQARFQRRADEHIHSHLKRVVEILETFHKTAPFERLVLSGTNEATSEMYRVLPKWMRTRVVGSLALPTGATDGEILAAVKTLENNVERGFEIAYVEKLMDAAGGSQKATASASETFRALNENRVLEFVYAEDCPMEGGRCSECGAVYASPDLSCDYCNIPVDAVEDVIECAASQALATGASIEQLRGEAAERLNALGGVGAFLRY